MQARHLADVMDQCGLGDAWSLSCGATTLGLSRADVVKKARNSPLLINVMGFCNDTEILALPERRAFLDIDPGFGQMWRELGLADVFAGHDAHITIGENIGQPDCEIPTCGLAWITTPQPVVLEDWQATNDFSGDAFTSIASWRGPFGPVEFRGQTYGLRVHEFRNFISLPRMSGERFALALEIDPVETTDIALLKENGWDLVDPRTAASTLDGYREFIRSSKAELMIAKNMYVRTHGGWFSDRSICYLASGRPVLAQETGFSENYPTGKGLIAFTTLEEAVAGVEEINENYREHCRVAREIAEEYFDSDKVLTRLLQKLGVE